MGLSAAPLPPLGQLLTDTTRSARGICGRAGRRICVSVMPSSNCSVRIRWSTAAWVAAEVADDAGRTAVGEAAGGAAVAVCGTGAVDADWARPTDGISRTARATLRARAEMSMIYSP